jgi:DNA-binding NarL/FixJ family response regulator
MDYGPWTNKKKMKTRIIIALPNRLLAGALAEYISAKSDDIEVCGIATDTRMIFLLLAKCHPCVVIYDPYLPGPGPEVTCSRLRSDFPGLKVILFKAANANGKYLQAERCNPAAIIDSDAGPEDLLALVKRVSSDRLSVISKQDQDTGNGSQVTDDLSARELQIVEFIVKGHCAKSISEILPITENTVRTHRQNILQKLGLNNKAQLISWYLTRPE